MMWIDYPPFRGTIVRGVGDEQTVQLLEARATVIEALEDLRKFRHGGLTFIRNAHGASVLPHTVTPAPTRKK